ncbi:MAG TPA: DedA family protein [Myxococcaceae bacterium]|nr:DedA family protein [Myxococcaceae bacterium]
MIERIDAWIQALGSAGYWVLGIAAMAEYLFPPFPGDTVTLFGGLYAVRGHRPWGWVLAAVTLGSVVGSAIDYAVGRRLGRRWERGATSGTLGSKALQLAARMRERGDSLLLLNRFLPAVRGLLFVAAGAARIPFARVMLLGASSALAWNGLLLVAGVALGGNAERLEFWVRRYYRGVYLLLLVAAAVWGIRWYLRRRSVRAPVPPGTGAAAPRRRPGPPG